MNRSLRNLLAIGALGILTFPVLAQQPPATGAPAAPGGGRAGRGQRGQGGQGQRRGVSLATMPVSVLDMIVTLNDDQKTKITAIQDKAKTDAAAAATGTDRTARQQVTQKATADIKAILTSDQTAALTKATPMLTLLNSSRVVPIAALPDVKLTKDQMTKIATITDTEEAKLKDVAAADRRTKSQEVNADFKTQVEALLTPTQKDAIAKYVAAHPVPNRRPAAPGAPAPGAAGA